MLLEVRTASNRRGYARDGLCEAAETMLAHRTSYEPTHFPTDLLVSFHAVRGQQMQKTEKGINWKRGDLRDF